MRIIHIAQLERELVRRQAPLPVADWPNIDWSIPSTEIAYITGADLSTVIRNRRKFAPHTLAPRNVPRNHKWDNVDWNKTDKQISIEVGELPGTVWKARKRIFDPTYDKSGRPTGVHPGDYDWASTDWSKPTSVIAEETGKHWTTVQRARRKHSSPQTNILSNASEPVTAVSQGFRIFRIASKP